MPSSRRQEGEEKMDMENVAEEIAYVNYKECVEVNFDALIATLWNKYIEYKGGFNKIFMNNKEFFKNSFKDKYDAAWAVSSGDWRWTDDFAYFDSEGNLSSFSHWDDERSPIDIDKIDISHIIQALQDIQTNDKRYVDNIPRAIHDALKE